jgi:hypothetical protein
MELFMMGAVAMGLFVAGLFFLKFWRDTNDRFFAIWAFAFWLLGLTRVMLVYLPTEGSDKDSVYWLRFLAFLLIVISIIDKNRRPRRP